MLTHNQAETMPFILRYRQQSIPVDGPEVTTIRAAACKYGVALVFGFSERAATTLYMSQVMLDHDGTVKLRRRKLKPTRFERELFGEGDGSDLHVAETSCGRIGALNCAENLQSLNKFALAGQGEQVHVSSWPFPLGSHVLTGASMAAISQTYAAENGAFVLMSTTVFSQDAINIFEMDRRYDPEQYLGGGYAGIFGPDMRRLTEPISPADEGIAYADIDLSLIERAKHTLDPTGHYARPDVFSVVIDRRPKPPIIDVAGVTGGSIYGAMETRDSGEQQPGGYDN